VTQDYSPADPPERPTAAPPAGVLPDPIIPRPKVVDYVASAAKMQNYMAAPNRPAPTLKVDLAQLAYEQAQIPPEQAEAEAYADKRAFRGVR
jgi:hypothetical protein